IALYNYAHIPDRFKGQRLIRAADLPSAEDRLQIFLMSMRRLLDAGYRYIGLDHFAKPDDELNIARENGTLHRNFQGYTTRAECDLVAFGMSAISKVGDSYSQSSHSITGYYKHLEEGRLPTEKGCHLSQDDVLRRAVIMDVMCGGPVRFASINHRYEIDFVDYFSTELARLAPYQEAGLVEITPEGIFVSAKGRLFVRGVGLVFDKYLRQPTTSSYSKLI
ncbi:MAG: oxygen-independent coproporphyrinogen III oxidase, partial [Herbaspirillum sp.]